MSQQFTLAAEARTDAGKGASRRLRRSGRIPGILYGGDATPQALSFEANELMRNMEQEAFFSSILTVNIGGQGLQAIVRDVQVHPAKRLVWHLDLQRISATEKLRLSVPLHFLNEATAPGLKQGGGTFSHLMTEVEVTCLPKDLPEYIEVDVGHMELDETIHLSQLKLPAGVEIPELAYGPDHDHAVISLHVLRGSAADEAAEAGEGEAAAAGEGEEKK